MIAGVLSERQDMFDGLFVENPVAGCKAGGQPSSDGLRGQEPDHRVTVVDRKL